MNNLKNQHFKNSSLVGSTVKSNLQYFQPRANTTYSLRKEQFISVADQIKEVVIKEFEKVKKNK